MQSERLVKIARYRGPKLLIKAAIYGVLAGLGFIFLYPLLYMLVTSFMGETDLVSRDGTC